MNKGNSRAYNRYNSRRKARRNRRLDMIDGEDPQFDNLHQYSKNKAKPFDSESEKTRNKGKRRTNHGNYDRSINYKPSDLRKVESMADGEADLAETQA